MSNMAAGRNWGRNQSKRCAKIVPDDRKLFYGKPLEMHTRSFCNSSSQTEKALGCQIDSQQPNVSGWTLQLIIL